MTTLTFGLSDAAIVIATVGGPILAVQAQKWLERDRTIMERRRQIFRTLMATRASGLAPAHVEALNAVPVEFYGPRKASLRTIVDNWHAYLDWLNIKNLPPEVWSQKRVELMTILLHSMSKYLGYGFSKSELEKDLYYPKGHEELENDQAIIRRGFVKLLSGEAAIPMTLKDLPIDDAAVELRKLMAAWLAGNSVVKVEKT
jgi:hypothetical protein